MVLSKTSEKSLIPRYRIPDYYGDAPIYLLDTIGMYSIKLLRSVDIPQREFASSELAIDFLRGCLQVVITERSQTCGVSRFLALLINLLYPVVPTYIGPVDRFDGAARFSLCPSRFYRYPRLASSQLLKYTLSQKGPPLLSRSSVFCERLFASRGLASCETFSPASPTRNLLVRSLA